MSWAKRIIELEILGEKIGRELRAEEAPLRPPRVEPIPYPYAYREVPAGETVTVYELRVPKGRVAYLQRVANNYYEGIKHYWEVDGKPLAVPPPPPPPRSGRTTAVRSASATGSAATAMS